MKTNIKKYLRSSIKVTFFKVALRQCPKHHLFRRIEWNKDINKKAIVEATERRNVLERIKAITAKKIKGECLLCVVI